MRRLAITLQIGALMILAMLIPVAAQGTTDTGSEWNVRGGVLFPQGDTVNNSEWFIGVERALSPVGELGNLTMSADYTTIETSTDDGTDRRSLLPIFLNVKQGVGKDTTNPWELGIGLGVYWVVDDIPDMRLDSGAHFAWQAEANYTVSQGWLLGARYMASENPGDSGLLAVQLGYRF